MDVREANQTNREYIGTTRSILCYGIAGLAIAGKSMSITKAVALLIPSVRALYEQRNLLASERMALLQRADVLQHEVARLAQEKLMIEAQLSQLTAELTLSRAAQERAEQELRAVAGRDEGRRGTRSVLKCIDNLARGANAIERRSKGSKAYAVIGSAGRTATQWITDAFNLHGKVFFSHGLDFSPRKQVADVDRTEKFLRMLDEAQQHGAIGVDQYFDVLETVGDFLALGNVHGLGGEHVFQFPEMYRRTYYVCAIVRHPVQRISSFINRFKFEIGVSPLRKEFYLDSFRRQEAEWIGSMASTYGIDARDDDAMLFMQALRSTLIHDFENFNSGMPIYQMERLVSDVEYFFGLFHDATAGLVDVTKEYAASVRALRPVDNLSDALRSANETFQTWARWEQNYFADEIQRLELGEAYGALGYNLRALFKARGV